MSTVSMHRITHVGSALALSAFLSVGAARAAGKPTLRELADRWRQREPKRFEELRRVFLQQLEERQAEREPAWRAGRRAQRPKPRVERSTRAGGVRVGSAFHSAGLATNEPRPLNPLLDPLGLFEDEAGEEPPVGPVPRLFFADFDGDGDLDVFVGDKYGYVRYLRNDTPAGSSQPVFVELIGAASPTGALDLSFAGAGGFPHGPSAPALADLDGDGDLDLFVGQGYDGTDGDGGRILFFENVGGTLVRNDAGNPFDGFLFGEIGATPTFVDIDQDGDLDAFVGVKIGDSPPAGQLYFLRNEGDATNPSFVDRTDQVGIDPFAGVSFLVSTAPTFADIDGDGDQDAFIGSGYTVRFFRNEAVLPAPAVFTEETGYDHPLGGGLTFVPGPVLADLDGDGDLDAFVGLGYFKDYDLGFVQYFENTGSATVPAFLAPSDRLELVDIDGDGDLDALVSHVLAVEEEFAPGREPLAAGGPLPLVAGDPAVGVWTFRNTGTPEAPRWELQTGAANPFATFNGTFFIGDTGYSVPSLAPTVGDLDGDAFLDAFVGFPDGSLEFLEDDGTGQLDPAATHPLEAISFDSNADPHFADVNGDGELDLVVGYEPYDPDDESYGSAVAFFLNLSGPDGLVPPPDFVLDFTDTNLDRPAPTLADVDGDGDLDLLVGGYYYDDEDYGSLTLFVENTGTPTSPAFDVSTAAPLELEMDFPSSPALGDLNGDGLLDVLIGNLGGVEAFLTRTAELEAIKEITGGDLVRGGTVQYTVTLTNVGTGTQPDDPDSPELIDTLPAGVALVSANVASGPGTVTVDLPGNTVRYDGELAPGQSAQIVIEANIDLDAGGTIENQAAVFYDTDNDGENDAASVSDEPSTPEPLDPTDFSISPVIEVPTLSRLGVGLLSGLLALLGALGLRRIGG